MQRLTEFPDRRVWDLTGYTLDEICLAYEVTLSLSDVEGSVTVILETPFSLLVGSRVDQLDPEQTMG